MSQERMFALLEDGELAIPRRATARRSVQLNTGSESFVQQAPLEESDINNIMRKYKVTGLVPQYEGEPMYGDFSALPSYQESLNTVIAAREAFEALPSDLRTRFDNDPQKIIDWVTDPKNLDEARKLGLAPPAKGPSDTDRVVEAVQSLKPTTEAVPPAKS